MIRRDRPTPTTTPAARAGLTLVEVMVAITIMGAIMLSLYTVLYGMIDTRDQLEHEAKAARLGPEILDVIENDLRRAWVMNILEDKVFKGEARILGGEHADRVAFLSTVDSIVSHPVEEGEYPSDLCETGYQLRVNPELTDVLELWRRQSLHIDKEPLEGGTYERLHDRVIAFRLRYYDRIDRFAEAYEEWDAEELHRLPAMVEIELELEVVPRTVDLPDHLSRNRSYRRMVTMLPDSDLAMRVHPLPPTFAYNPSGSGANQNQGDGEEGEDGGDEDGREDEEAPQDDAPGNEGETGVPGNLPGDPGEPGQSFEDILNELFNQGGGSGGN